MAGYLEALNAHGIRVQEQYIVRGDLTRPGGYQAAQSLLSLSDPPTAIVGSNDLTAIGAMNAALHQGIKVGKELGVVGFDGISDAETVQPSLTTLDQPVYEMAGGWSECFVCWLLKSLWKNNTYI